MSMGLPFHSRKYKLNEAFFSKWSSDMAYVLGFWFADGHMRISRSYRIYFTSRDIDHLKAIGETFLSNTPIISNGRSTSRPTLLLRSKQLYLDLLTLGGTPSKSTRMTFPNVPDYYLADFIRGYFDGDGSVHKISYRATKNGKLYTEIRTNFTSGSKQFLNVLKTILELKLQLKERVICRDGEHSYKLGYGQADTRKLLKFMYYSRHSIALQRKVEYLSLL